MVTDLEPRADCLSIKFLGKVNDEMGAVFKTHF